MTVVAELEPGRPAPKRRGRLSRLTKRDKLVLFVMCGIPTILLFAFVWLPAMASVALSFTTWDGIGGGGAPPRSCCPGPSGPGGGGGPPCLPRKGGGRGVGGQ